MRGEKPSNKNEINEIIIIYDYNKSKDVNIDIYYKEEIQKVIGETISREKLFWDRFVKIININAK